MTVFLCARASSYKVITLHENYIDLKVGGDKNAVCQSHTLNTQAFLWKMVCCMQRYTLPAITIETPSDNGYNFLLFCKQFKSGSCLPRKNTGRYNYL